MNVLPHSLSDFKGKRVLVRVDFNVPHSEGKVSDDFRITQVLPYLLELRRAGAKLILLSHRGEETESLQVVSSFLTNKFPHRFVKEWGEGVENTIEKMKEGEVVLLENVRMEAGEESNDKDFSKRLASLADVYVNEAFSASHREHASIVGVPRFLPHFAGRLFEKEVKELSRTFFAEQPFVVILGGAKVKTKLPLVKKFSKKATSIAIVGALVHDVLKAQGKEIGQSLVSEDVGDVSELLSLPQLVLPTDVVVKNNDRKNEVKKVNEVGKDDTIMDAGPETVLQLRTLIEGAAFVLWNGPLGNFEKGYSAGTRQIARAICHTWGVSIVGGGDTQAAIRTLGLAHSFTFVSTGGGAMLQFLADETLPGIEALS